MPSLDRVAARNATAFSYNGGAIDPVSVGAETYGRGPGGNVASVNTATATVAVTDRHGDLVATISTDGTLASSRTYDPFGDPVDTIGTPGALGYQSDYTDPTTGDVWMGARWYTPTTATFRSRDTVFGELSTPVSLNRYTYANNNPNTYWDPDGRFGISLLPGALDKLRELLAADKRRAAAVASRSLAATVRGAHTIASRAELVAEVLAKPSSDRHKNAAAALFAAEYRPYQASAASAATFEAAVLETTLDADRQFLALARIDHLAAANPVGIELIAQPTRAADVFYASNGCDHYRGAEVGAINCNVDNSIRPALEIALIVPSMFPVVGEVIDGGFCAYDTINHVAGNGSGMDMGISCGALLVPFAGAAATRRVASLAPNTRPAFVAGRIGSEPPVPLSQSRMAEGLGAAGFPRTSTTAPGVQYTLPDGSTVRLMEPSGQTGWRASFENANGGPINPFTGKPPPNPPPGLTRAERLEWVRAQTHVEQYA